MTELKDRIRELMDDMKWIEQDVAKTAQVSLSAVLQWLGKGGENSKEIKSLSTKPACLLAEATGYRALWLAYGWMPKKSNEARRISPEWPFKMVDKDLYLGLDDEHKLVVQGKIDTVLRNYVDQVDTAHKGKSAA